MMMLRLSLNLMAFMLVLINININAEFAPLTFKLQLDFGQDVPQDSILQAIFEGQIETYVDEQLSIADAVNNIVSDYSEGKFLLTFNPAVVTDDMVEDVLGVLGNKLEDGPIELGNDFELKSVSLVERTTTISPTVMPTSSSPTSQTFLTEAMKIVVEGLTEADVNTPTQASSVTNSVTNFVQAAAPSPSVVQVNIAENNMFFLVFFDSSTTHDGMLKSAKANLDLSLRKTPFDCCSNLVLKEIFLTPIPTTCKLNDGCPPGVSSTTAATKSSTNNDSGDAGIIATIAVVIIVLLILVVVAIVYICRKGTVESAANSDHSNTPAAVIATPSHQQNQGFLLSNRATAFPDKTTTDQPRTFTSSHIAIESSSDALGGRGRVATNTDLGKRVVVDGFNSKGKVRYVGKIGGSMNKSEFFGIEFDSPVGTSNGSWFGESYFECSPKHGHFIPIDNNAVFMAKRSSTLTGNVSKPANVSAQKNTDATIPQTNAFPKGRCATLSDVGKRVVVEGYPCKGMLKHAGALKGADSATGNWFGIVLDEACGNSDGALNGQTYFQTFFNRGVFIPVESGKVHIAKRSKGTDTLDISTTSDPISTTSDPIQPKRERSITLRREPETSSELFGATLLKLDPVDYDESRKQSARERAGPFAANDFTGFDSASFKKNKNTTTTNGDNGYEVEMPDEDPDADYENLKNLNLPAEDNDADYENTHTLRNTRDGTLPRTPRSHANVNANTDDDGDDGDDDHDYENDFDDYENTKDLISLQDSNETQRFLSMDNEHGFGAEEPDAVYQNVATDI